MTFKETKCCGKCDDGILTEICGTCNGSGEGFFDGSTCLVCKGKGTEKDYCDCSKGDERLSKEIF